MKRFGRCFAIILVIVLAVMALLCASCCTLVPSLAGTVKDKETGEPLSGVLLQVHYGGTKFGFIQSAGVTFANDYYATDEKGRFVVPRKLIFVADPLTNFRYVSITPIHPFYAYDTIGISESKFSHRDCKDIQFELVPLEADMLKRECGIRWALSDFYEEYFFQSEQLGLPLSLEQACEGWRRVAEKFPEGRRKEIEAEIKSMEQWTRTRLKQRKR